MKSLFLLSGLLLLSVFSTQTVEAGLSNGGRMQSTHLQLSVGGTLDNNGELIGTETANLACDTLSGKGLIRSPQISIRAKLFAYTGTIDCNGKCTIVTSAPFNEKMFKRKGGGEFVILIDEKLGKKAEVQAGEFDYEISDGLQISVE